ncbi:MarR family transcriptional regulator [Dickeya dianthicola]|uniref:MarR family transcriptional regulator n=1 Tax=Dickeya dianthicola TaxID=204039 RepID=A0ABX9NL65_9GAMM|nr:MarR family transcriptional regulator [Dickeya dianthicola]MCI4070305.1 MarR family transcriptional regulator [Dickeya dianthicola]MCI4113650.1 MarR family transcriptional regulator [Dickeya dianthicola]MCI4117702.1 MarR family transcriptional regulator [Dickeya dianthicola]MCI4122351.1 MarR family transcriptional regulator [Dickeya dianthicola]MCI4192653.1 MarR family transcriptional regulator [Dickeya dianthicola]
MNHTTTETLYPIGLLIHLANQFKDNLLTDYFADSDITAPQFKVLISIYKGFTSPVEVSKNVMMDGGALSRMIERMVKRELIVRQPHPCDKRQVILALTEKGLAIYQHFEQEGMRIVLAQTTARLTPQEVEQLMRLLTKMLPDDVIARYLPY